LLEVGGRNLSGIDPSIYQPGGIAAGPDGALWFTNSNDSVGRITTAATG
jgi:streptogramin lyase